MIYFVLIFELINIILFVSGDITSLNEFDTYNAEECQRIRRAWHKLSREERDIYISGLLELRKNGNGDIYKDELISIGSVHDEDLRYTGLIHATSSYLFWHGYLIWELESRIRNLGGKYRCFGMPYWDVTLESGREYAPLIFEGGEIGGNGDPNNHWTVNEFSWKPSIEQYWVPNNCVAQNDEYPICSLKRELRSDFTMPSAEKVGEFIINNTNFIDFDGGINGAMLLIGAYDAQDMDAAPQGYEPIWYLYHSMMQMNQALWVNCHNYDLIQIKDLHKYPQAFTPFCNENVDGYNAKWTQWGLDDNMHFGGWLQDQEWSYIHNQNLSVRKLYMLPKWNIIYDLDNGDGFYKDSGLMQYCKGKINNHWFILNENQEIENTIEANSYSMNPLNPLNPLNTLLIVLTIVSILKIGYVLCRRHLFKTHKQIKTHGAQNDYIYGSV